MPQRRRDWIRAEMERFPNPGCLHIEPGSRGAMIGRIDDVIAEAAASIGLPVSNAREIRLALASKVYERKITTYNQLTDAELFAIDRWMRLGDVAVKEMAAWLKKEYGEQLSLFGGEPTNEENSQYPLFRGQPAGSTPGH